jgi:hypothetical protein
MTSDIEPHLEALSAKYQGNNRKLARPEVEEASKLCREAFAQEAGGVELFFRLATSLPPEAIAPALAENWSSFDDARRRQLVERLQRLPEPGGKRLRLTLSAALQKADPWLACQILTQTCRTLLDHKNQRPGKKNISMFCNVLLDKREPALVGFQLPDPIQAEVAPLLACVVAAVFTAPENDLPNFSPIAPRVLEWLWRQQLFVLLKAEQRMTIRTAAVCWPPSAKAEFIGKFDALPADFTFFIQPEAVRSESPPHPAASPRPGFAGGERAPDSTPRESLPSGPGPFKPETPQVLPPHELLARLGEAFREFENAYRNVLRERNEARSVTHALQMRLAAAETDLHRVERELRESREQLDQSSAECALMQREATQLREETDRLRARITAVPARSWRQIQRRRAVLNGFRPQEIVPHIRPEARAEAHSHVQQTQRRDRPEARVPAVSPAATRSEPLFVPAWKGMFVLRRLT